MKKVFLGGTCGDSKWRDEIIPMLSIDYFNPVVKVWTEDNYKEEELQKEICDYLLYVISPLMEGIYSIAEEIDDSNKRPAKTIFCILESENGHAFTLNQMKSLEKVAEIVRNNGGIVFYSLNDVAEYLNKN